MLTISVKKTRKIRLHFWSLVQFYCISLLSAKYFVEDCSSNSTKAMNNNRKLLSSRIWWIHHSWRHNLKVHVTLNNWYLFPFTRLILYIHIWCKRLFLSSPVKVTKINMENRKTWPKFLSLKIIWTCNFEELMAAFPANYWMELKAKSCFLLKFNISSVVSELCKFFCK